MCVKAAGNFSRNAQMVHTGAGRSQFQAYPLYRKRIFIVISQRKPKI